MSRKFEVFVKQRCPEPTTPSEKFSCGEEEELYNLEKRDRDLFFYVVGSTPQMGARTGEGGGMDGWLHQSLIFIW